MQHLTQTLHKQQAAFAAQPYPSYAERRHDLLQLKAFLKDHTEAIVSAISADYGHRSRHETLFGDVAPVLQAIDHALKHLKTWMKPQRRSVDWLNFMGAKNRVLAQPLGVVGIIVPWNFPINLSFMVLVDVIAAGNCAMVKMSENSRHLAQLLIERSPKYFDVNKLSFFDETGGVGVAFSQLKFDHLVFTGSTQTGKAVMAAAASNLCPVTLELGGKSPALVCEDFPLRKAVERIMFMKCFNAGQICTDVDHVYVPHHSVKAFASLAQEVVQQRFADLDSPDFTSIIDDRSFQRLVDALQEAQSQGATLVQLLPGKPWDAQTRKIAPHVVLNAPPSCALLTREIFGPILPVLAYTHIDEAVASINAAPHPLAFYPFSNDAAVVQHLITHIRSGGVCVNDAVFHTAQHDLPFGGVGDSGMGHYHGRAGFEAFSHMRAVLYQSAFSGMRFMWPPYRQFANKYLAFLLK